MAKVALAFLILSIGLIMHVQASENSNGTFMPLSLEQRSRLLSQIASKEDHAILLAAYNALISGTEYDPEKKEVSELNGTNSEIKSPTLKEK